MAKQYTPEELKMIKEKPKLWKAIRKLRQGTEVKAKEMWRLIGKKK